MVNLERAYRIPFFKENGYVRKKCKSCGSPFWTKNKEQELCGDSPCVEYSFIGSPITERMYDVDEMREAFLSFFEKNGHSRIGGYPVIARWRDDIFLTIASIADFQPHVTSGECEPPANPLCISQPCIRLNDLDSVGRSGRHLTNFEMMAHHAFNYKRKKVYWINETVAYCDGFLKSIGVDTDLVTYKENPWSGGGNAGPALEVLSHGLELVTLVFMSLRLASDSDEDTAVIEGERYTPMDMRIVDTGYGLERLAWASQGVPTIYHAIYPEMVEDLLKRAGIDTKNERTSLIIRESAKLAGSMSVNTKSNLRHFRGMCSERMKALGYDIAPEEIGEIMGPIESVYALCDHTKCIALMLGDGIVPSNSKAGYLARLMVRRSVKLLQDLNADVTLEELIERHIRSRLKRYESDIGRILDIVSLEEKRYGETIERGKAMVKREVKGNATLDDLIRFYDTYGIPPEIVKTIVDVEIPENFYSIIAQMHSREKESVAATEEVLYQLKPTELLFYDRPRDYDFEAEVLKSDGKLLVLDRTLFYPEGGGQPSDVGSILYDGKETNVVHADKSSDGVVVHHLDSDLWLREGSIVHGHVDEKRRRALERNHTATHIILSSARELFGKHIWQHGAQKGIERSRLDITHYSRIERDDLERIEKRANEIVLADMPIEAKFMKRNEADRKYGFVLYEGGVPKGNRIRVVTIDGIDAQACAGTHCQRTGEVGWIKILHTERVQDGVERIDFAVADSALEEFERKERMIERLCETFNTKEEHLERASGRIFTEWKDLRKEMERLSGYVIEERVKGIVSRAEERDGVVIVKDINELDSKSIVKEAVMLADHPGFFAIAANTMGNVAVARNESLDISSVDILREVEKFNGKAGGKANLAQGSVPAENVRSAVDYLEEMVKLRLVEKRLED
jgi:alanyl-tRNA synthetase